MRRVLPTVGRKSVGPRVFFDHMGPAVFPAGQGINVRPHPHINLGTVTYLFEGEILHRDSLGSPQPIRPGDNPGRRHIEWNFVSSRKERIEQAKMDWKEGRFPTVPGDEEEFIPLP